MTHQALARKWRPRRFDAVVGQDHVRRALQNALSSGRLHHAYLFTGTRGVGKTTLARLFAKALNCEAGPASEPCGQCSACTALDGGRFLDLIEVDAASRTGVDDTRDLLESAQYAPAQGRFKVYLIDEVHMFSRSSFNALLKTLEEPPAHVKFLLATTDPQKLPPTVLSRCLQFQLRALPAARIAAHLSELLAAEGIAAEAPALAELARAARGSVRDALSLLDQALAHAGGALDAAQVRAMLGTLDRAHAAHLLRAVAAGDASAALAALDEAQAQAADPGAVLDDVIALTHQVALHQLLPDAALADDADPAEIAALAQALPPDQVQLIYQIALHGRRDLPLAPDARIGLEMVLLRWLAFRPEGAPLPGPTPAGTARNGASRGPAQGPVRPSAAPAVRSEAVPGAAGPSTVSTPARPVTAASVSPAGRPGAPDITLPAAEAPVQSPTPTRPETSTQAQVPGTGRAHSVVSPTSPAGAPLPAWQTLVGELDLGGAARALALNCVLLNAHDGVFELALDPGARALLTPGSQSRLELALTERTGQAAAVRISVATDAGDTPARQAALADAARRTQAHTDLLAESAVQALVQDAGARLVEGSLTLPPETH